MTFTVMKSGWLEKMSEKGLDWRKEGQFSKICGIIYHGAILSSQQLLNTGNAVYQSN